MKRKTKKRAPVAVKPGTTKQVPFAFASYTSAVLLLTLLIFCWPSMERLFRIYLLGDGTPRFTSHARIGDVPVKWWYTRWAASEKDPFNFLGLTFLKQVNEIVKEPVLDQSLGGGPLKINSHVFPYGIGTHAPSKVALDLKGKYDRFTCQVGLDMTCGPNLGAVFIVTADGKEIFHSPRMGPDADPYPIDCAVTGVNELILEVQNRNEDQSDNADWVDLRFIQVPKDDKKKL